MHEVNEVRSIDLRTSRCLGLQDEPEDGRKKDVNAGLENRSSAVWFLAATDMKSKLVFDRRRLM